MGKTKNWPTSVAIGWDTRASGRELAESFAQGFLSCGEAKLSFLNVTPTPAIAYFVEKEGLSLGVSITASHNPSTDNGLKLFQRGGHKLCRADEALIETLAKQFSPNNLPVLNNVREVDGSSYYVDALRTEYSNLNFANKTIVLDTANGATAFTSLPYLRSLGLNVIALGDAPDGRNINEDCGSEHTDHLLRKVIESGAWLGIAHDGDGDRIVVIDEQGERLDGDQVLGMLALDFLEQNRLNPKYIVLTEQSNSGLDSTLAAYGIQTTRTDVGDREVFYGMLKQGARLGGESSGHIILRDQANTGDGLRVALLLMQMALKKPLCERKKQIHLKEKLEQSLRVSAKIPLSSMRHTLDFKRSCEKDEVRMCVRFSGTENKLRFLVEAGTAEKCQQILEAWLLEAKRDFQEHGIVVK